MIQLYISLCRSVQSLAASHTPQYTIKCMWTADHAFQYAVRWRACEQLAIHRSTLSNDVHMGS